MGSGQARGSAPSDSGRPTGAPSAVLPSSGDPGQSIKRLDGMDALRAGALLLGILLHALMPFLPGDLWLVNDKYDEVGVLFAIVPIHLFRMMLFLVMAGFFGAMSRGRRGTPGFLRDRAVRILLPLVVFWPAAVMSLGPIIIADRQRTGAAMPEVRVTSILDISPGQLWFLWVLFECYLIVLAAGWLLGRLPNANSVRDKAGRLLTTPWGIVVGAVSFAAASLLQGHTVEGITEPTTLVPEPRGLVAYAGALTIGWLLWHGRDSLQAISRHWVAYLVAAVAGTALATLLGGASPLGQPLPSWVKAGLAGLAAWSWVYGLTGVALRCIRREIPAVRYLADASYWLYLLHLPLLVGLEFLVAQLDWPVAVKLLAVVSVTVGILLVSYDLIVRPTFVGAWLNGHRRPRVLFRGRSTPPETAS